MKKKELLFALDEIFNDSNVTFQRITLQEKINNITQGGHQSGTRRQNLERSLDSDTEDYLSDEEIQRMQRALNQMKKLLSKHRKERLFLQKEKLSQ